MARKLPHQDDLLRSLSYDPTSGYLYWRDRDDRSREWNSRWAGKRAFTARGHKGYYTGAFNGSQYYAHRVIWKMLKGEEPDVIDHIDGTISDNRLENLRSVPSLDNQRNMRRMSSNTSGINGVGWSAPTKKWAAYIRVDGKRIHLGYFETKEQAASARRRADARYGFHPNHGR
jgi:hypothetical protein